MVPISNTGSVPKTVTWYWYSVCTEPNFSTWWDILQKSASTFSNFSTHQFWSQKQLKTKWAHFFEHKEHPQFANI